ncbi:hypothetical protein CYMTET_55474 [Cymbomonas tetramitiformis]|uniref:EF-hand domain-containing protein n=1 Tax=Cymbomonas tetramitiformis TaxID=36881 RepID=A0AAE0BE11_9CHLO|nr:hypothetical protein CYMTET_55474 [Cymbomonas tetramitiformis]
MGKKARGKARPKRVDIIEKDGSATGDFERVLRDIFDRFDADKDEKLSQEELNCFARACNDGVPFSADELSEIVTYFDVDEGNRLTFQGFKELMVTQSCSRPEDTWRDLERLGRTSD